MRIATQIADAQAELEEACTPEEEAEAKRKLAEVWERKDALPIVEQTYWNAAYHLSDGGRNQWPGTYPGRMLRMLECGQRWRVRWQSNIHLQKESSEKDDCIHPSGGNARKVCTGDTSPPDVADCIR
jgi:hypothetical protein